MAGAMGAMGGGTEWRRRVAGARALCLLAPWLAAGPAWPAGDGCGGGYRREGVISDFALGRAWTVYSSCGRPAGPRIAVPDGSGAPKAAPGAVPESARGVGSAGPVSAGLASPGAVSGGGAFRAARPSPAAAQPLESALESALNSASGSPLAPAPPPPLVRTGARVRLWLATPVARIELWGVALENGAAGAAVRVRTAPGGKVLDGTVRGADSVELSPEGFGGGGR